MYTKTVWADKVDGVSPGTPFNATNMNKIEKALYLTNTIFPTSGPANVYATTIEGISSMADLEGYPIKVQINIDATGASTLNVNEIGAIPLKKPNGDDVIRSKAGSIYAYIYDGDSNFRSPCEGGEYNIGDFIAPASLEYMALQLPYSIITNSTASYLYMPKDALNGYSDTWLRLNPTTGAKIWESTLLADDGFSPNGYFPLGVDSNGVLWGQSSDRLLTGRRMVALSNAGVFSKSTEWLYGSGGGQPIFNPIGKIQGAMSPSASIYYVYIYNSDTITGVSRWNAFTRSWVIARTPQAQCVAIQASTGYLIIPINNGDGTYTIYRYNATTGAAISSNTTANLGNNSMVIYYFGSDEVYFIASGSDIFRINVNTGATINSNLNSSIVYPIVLCDFDASYVLVSEDSGANLYKLYKLLKADLTTKVEVTGPSAILVAAQKRIGYFLYLSAADLMYIQTYGKLGFTNTGIKILS